MNIKPFQNCEEFSLSNQNTLPAWNEQGNGHYGTLLPEWSEHDNGYHESIPPNWVDHPVKEQKPVEAVPNAGAWVMPLIAGLAFAWKCYIYWR